ncbi:MAG: hypothetical protein MJ183_00250 [Treponemataceae bacterium]|nr:hypothetical protein [Treponemataceae bacterium]
MKNCIFALFLAGLCLFFSSCEETSAVSSLNTESLFSIPYGSYENELPLFSNLTGNNHEASVVMRDGFFFVADSEAAKVCQFNSYGDLISVCYNEEKNPVPSFIEFSGIQLQSDGIASDSATQRATTYSFRNISSLAVDTERNFYVVDYLSDDRYEFSTDDDMLLRQIVLRFSSEGDYIDFIGQQGPGGTPFPYITDIYTNSQNELIVIAITEKQAIAYWFSSDGFLKYQIPFDYNQLPLEEEDRNKELFAHLDTIFPDYNEQKLYLKIDYSFVEYDESTKILAGMKFGKTLLYPLNLESGTYERPIHIPVYEKTIVEDFSRVSYSVPYDFLGMTESGWFYFCIAEDDGYSVCFVHSGGQKSIRRNLSCDTKNLVYHDLNVSPQGIISALHCQDDRASVVWWRTDSVIDSILNGVSSVTLNFK